MTILDALEQRVMGLLEEVAILRGEKTRLEKQFSESSGRMENKDKLEQLSEYLARIAELESCLAAEREHKAAVLERIDNLVLRLEGMTARANSAG
jgi:hypothetical protein